MSDQHRDEVAALVEQFISVKLTGVGGWMAQKMVNGLGQTYEEPGGVSFTLTWAARDIGGGEARFYVQDDKALCDDEAMDPAFVEALLIAYARTLTLTHQ